MHVRRRGAVLANQFLINRGIRYRNFSRLNQRVSSVGRERIGIYYNTVQKREFCAASAVGGLAFMFVGMDETLKAVGFGLLVSSFFFDCPNPFDDQGPKDSES